MAIRAVTFDADGTLWDFDTAMWGGLAAVVDAAERARPELQGRVHAAELQALRDQLAAARNGSRESLASVRRRSFQVALEQLGVRDAALADDLARRYFRYRHEELRLFDDVAGGLARLGERYTLGLVTNGNSDPERSGLPGVFAFRLVADAIGIAKPDPRLFTMAAAAVPCRPSELVHVGDHLDKDVAAARAAGCRAVWIDRTAHSSFATPRGQTRRADTVADATVSSLDELPDVLAAFEQATAEELASVGVGPHPRPWPVDARLDPDLLAGGDRRNVVDRYRYWRTDAVASDLDQRRHPFHVAIENWQHDLNIGTVVRNANAFLASSVRVVGRRRWNRRGAMVTDRYQHVVHHPDIDALRAWAEDEGLPIIAVDNLPGARTLDEIALPRACVLLFGQEGRGLSEAARDAAQVVGAIRQFGSTRSINAGVASGIAMHAWTVQHAERA